MSPDCYPIEEIGELIELDPRDPRLAHARQCARCRNLLISMREFRSPSATSDGARIEQAEIHMGRFMADELRPIRNPHRDLGAGLSSFFNPIRQLLTRPAMGLAFILLAVVVGYGINERMKPSDQIRLRGTGAADKAQLSLATPRYQTDGALILSWRNLELAENYEVVFISSSLDELGRLAVGADTMLVVSPATMAQFNPEGRQLLWQVQVIGQNRDVIRSRPVEIPAP